MTTPEHSAGSEAGPLTQPADLRGKRLPPQIGKRPARKSAFGISKILKVLGPGLITGAADDDPSGIATYSSVGAQYGYGMLWTMPFVYPFMAGTQEISARLGRVSGRGIAGNMCFMMFIAGNRKIMGKFTLPLYLQILGWAGTLIMGFAAVGMLLHGAAGK
jgi:Mn2+/Fe2+ NRAMP family transporter